MGRGGCIRGADCGVENSTENAAISIGICSSYVDHEAVVGVLREPVELLQSQPETDADAFS